MARVRALTQHIYAGINHEAGEEYDAPEDRLQEIIGFGWVSLVEEAKQPKPPQPPKPPKPPQPTPPPKGAYETRDLKAGNK